MEEGRWLLQVAVVGRPGPRRRRWSATVATIATLLTVSCGGGGGQTGQGSISPDASAEISSSQSSPSPTSASGVPYSTKAFESPLTVTVPPLFGAQPVTDDKHLLKWEGENDTRIRFLLPASVYPYIDTSETPRSAYPTPVDPPRDYVQYLMKHSRLGVKIDDVVKTRVGGRSATLMSVALPHPSWATEGGLDGSLGCPEKAMEPSEECFGIQPSGPIRLAVIKVNGNTLVAWAGTSEQAGPSIARTFEQVLRTVKFR